MKNQKLFGNVFIRSFRNLLICLSFFFAVNLNILHEFEKDSKNILNTEQEKDKACIVEALWYEARGEGKTGMQAVLTVIKNRKEHPAFPSTYCGVIQQHKQFSYRNHLSPGKMLKTSYKQHEEETLGIAQDLAEQAVYGTFKPVLGPSVIFYHTLKVNPRWSKKMQKVATIGNHAFFAKIERNKDAKI